MSLEESLNKVKTLRSTKIPAQQRQVALLDGVEALLREEHQELNATAYFATLLSLLDREDVAEVAIELLAYVVPHVPKALLASKIDVAVAKLLPILLNDSGTALARSSIAVFESILISIDAMAWKTPLSQLGAQRTFSGVLTLAQDARPKIRKRSIEAVRRILAEGNGGHALALEISLTATTSCVDSGNLQKLLHTLQLLKAVLSESKDIPDKQIDHILRLLLHIVRGSDYLTVLAVFGVLDALPSDDTRVTRALLDLSPAVNDRQLAPVWLAGLAQRQPPIIDVISTVSNYLTSDHPEVVESCGQCLIALISDSFYSEDMRLTNILATEHFFPLLQVKYNGAWATVCEVCAAFIATLPYEMAPKLEGVLNIVRVVGALRTTRNEADQVVGSAIRILGPEVVCKLIPLNLDPQNGSGNAWLLPLLAEHTSHTNVAFYFDNLLPLANSFEIQAKSIPESRKSKILLTIADQLLGLFPRFCHECQDDISREQIQEVLGWLYSKPSTRPFVCLGIKLYVDTAINSKVFVENFGSDVLKSLLNVFQGMQVETRGYVLETVDSLIAALPSTEVAQLFDQTSALLAQNIENEEKRHTLMDIVNALVPYLDESVADILFNLFRIVGTMSDAIMQKKAYKVLVQFQPGIDYRKLSPLLLQMQSGVMPNARKTRLQALGLVGKAIPDDGDFSFIFRTLPEAILGTKDPNEKTREAAFNLLILYGQRMQSASKGIVDHAKIPELVGDNTKAAASLMEYFEMIMAGLAGNTSHMIAATTTALARILYEFHHVLPREKLIEYIELVWMLLESANREIITAVLGFVKVSVLIMPIVELNAKLPSLLSLMLSWSNVHKNHFKGRVKHLIERLLRRCGYDALKSAFPESEVKLLQNIQKSKERSRRRRSVPSSKTEDPSSDAQTKKRKFENEFDEALYGSESENDSDEDGDEAPESKRSAHSQTKASKSRKDRFIVSGQDPLDLLDERAISHISSTKSATNNHDRRFKHPLPESKDGKLIIGRNSVADPEKSRSDALSAYMAAVREGPIRTQQGKLKYRRGKKALKENDDDIADEHTKPNLKGAKVGKNVNLKTHMQRRKRL